MPTLDWLNRADAFTTAAKVPYRLLEPVSHHGDLHAKDNLLIQGDNLEALKALLPFYRGQVKCIFIDPPYNTKSAFEHYDDNLEHAQWLSMMLPRLQLLRELLREDGSIWVTIDDNEGHYLKVMMDEVFGRGNFVSTVIWQKKYAPKSDSKYLSESHDFVLGYAKKLDALTLNRIVKGDKQIARYTNRDSDPRGPWKASDVLRSEVRDYAIFPVNLPSGKEVWPPSGTSWRYTKEKFAELIADNRIWFGIDGDARPAYKRFLSEVTDSMPATTIWSYDEVGHNDESKKEMRSLFNEDLFGTPKPERLLQRILHITTNENDLILDSFLGSGTTAAVAHKMGRRWIGIEMGEHAATHCLPRMQKVVDGEQGGISKASRCLTRRAVSTARCALPRWRPLCGNKKLAPRSAPRWLKQARLTLAHTIFMIAYLAIFHWIQSLFHHQTSALQRRQTCSRRPCHLPTTQRLPVPQQPRRPPAPPFYLLFNGILKDKRPASGNVLTQAVLDALLQLHASTPSPDAPLVVYGEACRLGAERLQRANVTFKHIPYDVKAR
jgi:adenine-specific DNA-methyltransferase